MKRRGPEQLKPISDTPPEEFLPRGHADMAEMERALREGDLATVTLQLPHIFTCPQDCFPKFQKIVDSIHGELRRK